MPDDGIIALDNGVYKIWFARNYKAYRPNTVLLDNALATMGRVCLPPWLPTLFIPIKKSLLFVAMEGSW